MLRVYKKGLSNLRHISSCFAVRDGDRHCFQMWKSGVCILAIDSRVFVITVPRVTIVIQHRIFVIFVFIFTH